MARLLIHNLCAQNKESFFTLHNLTLQCTVNLAKEICQGPEYTFTAGRAVSFASTMLSPGQNLLSNIQSSKGFFYFLRGSNTVLMSN